MIRTYRPEDAEGVKQLTDTVMQGLFNQESRNVSDLDDIEGQYRVFYVFEEDGKIVGSVGICDDEEGARLRRMYVDPDHRRQGIGKKLLASAISYCHDEGYGRVVLSTYIEMIDALRFYIEHGFVAYKRGNRIHMRLDI